MCMHSKLYSILLYKVPSCLIFYLLNLFFGIFVHIYAASRLPYTHLPCLPRTSDLCQPCCCCYCSGGCYYYSESWSCLVTLKLTVLLPQPPDCCSYRCVLLYQVVPFYVFQTLEPDVLAHICNLSI